MGKIKKILENELIGGTQNTDVYPVTSTKAVYDTGNKVLDDYIQHLKKTSTFAGVATPTTNPGTPDGNVFYIAGEGSYPNFNNQVVGVGQIAVLKWDGSWHKEVLEIGAKGGNMILDWNTDVATTRKQVLSKYRKPGVQISYKDPINGWINEQYIGTLTTDTEWVKGTNWEIVVSKNMLGLFDKKANEQIVDNSSVGIYSGYHNTATTIQVNSSWVYTDMFEVFPNSTIYCNIPCNIYFYKKSDKNTYYQSSSILLNANQSIVVPTDCFYMLITYVSNLQQFSIKYAYDYNSMLANIQKELNILQENTVKKDIIAGEKYIQYNELTLNDGYKNSADTTQNLQGWKYTGKVPVFAESKLHTNKDIRVLFYRNVLDSSYIDKAVLTVSANSNFDVPKETNYIIITFSTNIGEDLLISYAEEYYSKPAILQQQITDNTAKINVVPLSELDETYFEINKDEFIQGFIQPNGNIQTGSVVKSWGYCETYFSVSPKITYNLIKEVFKSASIIEYDKNLNVVKSTSNLGIFTPQENTKYIRITAADYTLEGAKIKLLYNGIYFKPFQDHFLTDLQKDEMQIFKKFNQGLFKSINGKAILTLVDDDCFWNNYNIPQNDMKLKALCDERNIRCTFACITKNWTEKNWQNMIEWQQQGYHFVSHSYSHWDTSTDAKLEEEFAHPLSDLTKNGAVHCDYFVYPFGGLSGQNDKVNRLSQKYYKCSVTTTEGINRYADRNRFQLYRLMYSDSLTDEKFNGYIDDLSTNGGWLIFGSHSGDSRSAYWDTDRYKTMLDYALSKGNIEVMTLYEAWELYKLYYIYKDIFIE